MAKTQIQVVIDAKDNATKVLKGLGDQFSVLKGQSKQLESDLKNLGKFALVGVAAMATFAATAGMSAARVEELEFALDAVAKANNVSQVAVDDTVDSLRGMNIAHQKALQISALFIQSQLDLADATKLASAAKDLAVIAGLDSSEATETLTRAIVMQRPMLLKQFGIVKGLDQIYGDYSESTGKSATELTELEKRQAFLNAILESGEKVAGTYDAAMGSVSKRFRSLTGRVIPDFMAKIGKAFSPALTVIIDAVSKSIEEMSNWIDENKEGIADWGEKMGKAIGKALEVFKKIVKYLIKNKGIIVGVLVAMGVGVAVLVGAFIIAHSAIIILIAGITAVIFFLSDRWKKLVEGFEAWGEIFSAIAETVGNAWGDFKTGLGETLTEVEDNMSTTAENAKTTWDDFKTGIGTGLLEMEESFKTWSETVGQNIEHLPESLAFLAGYLVEVAPVAWEEFKTGVGETLLEMEIEQKKRTTNMKADWEEFKTELGVTLSEMEINNKKFIATAKVDWEDFKTGVGISLFELETDMKLRVKNMGKAWEDFKTDLGVALFEMETAIRGFIKNIVPSWDTFVENMGKSLDGLKQKFSDFIDRIKEAFMLGRQAGEERNARNAQTGGIVPGPIGAAVPIIAHAGEKIISAGIATGGSGGGGGVNLQVNIGLYAGTETEKRNIAKNLYAALVQTAQAQNKTVFELMET